MRSQFGACLVGAMAILAAGQAVAQSVDEVNARLDTIIGDHELFEAAFDALTIAVSLEDAETVASLVRYPFRVTIDGESYSLRSEEAFVERYDQIITEHVAEVLLNQDYAELFVNQNGVMFGDGELWMNASCLSNDCSRLVWLIIAVNTEIDAQN